ncbi:hypothetical protein FHS20_004051 [Phyllobacterium endophyticum]|nr:hypothetical protein [Phyllobacterium endophyticum]
MIFACWTQQRAFPTLSDYELAPAAFGTKHFNKLALVVDALTFSRTQILNFNVYEVVTG